MQFQVPQFVETEDKIIGPFTLKQFLYIAAAGGISFLLFFFIKFSLWAVLSSFILAIAFSLGFIKINGRSLPTLIRAAIIYYWKPRFFLWQRKEKAEEKAVRELQSEKAAAPFKEKLSITGRIKSILEKLETSRNPIPKREKTIPLPRKTKTIKVVEHKGKERFVVLRKLTGEREIARRVDYR